MSYLKKINIPFCILASPFLIDGIALFLVQKPIATMAIKDLIAGRHWYDETHYGIGPYGAGLVSIFVFIIACILYRDKYTISNPSLNIDLVLSDDKKWIEEIKQRSNRKQKIIAYSKDGAVVARRKAKALGLEKCFIDFKSAEEINEKKTY